MSEPIENQYFNWLCAKVLDVKVPIYFDLMRILHQTEFIWVVPRDRSREEDGLELRTDFLREAMLEDDSEWFNQPCSVLEVLIAFSNRASFQTDVPARDWFWRFITNLELDDYRKVSEDEEPYVKDILYTFVWRTYDPSGYGGIFPMRWPQRDQRKVELWYQFNEYLDDQGLI